MNFDTIKVRFQDNICFIQFHRPQANNTINNQMVIEFNQILEQCEQQATVVVLEGLPEVFCFGADFAEMQEASHADGEEYGPPPLYDVWQRLATGPFVSIAHVRGKVNAGGIGFVAACDIVLAEDAATFSLSELLFGLMPAFVMPYIIRRMGFQKANYLTLMTLPINTQQALSWGLVDAADANSESLLRRHLLRLRRLSKTAIMRYKRYTNQLNDSLTPAKELATSANKEVFSDPANLAGIARFVETGVFPWE